ncbi:hypothetical protein M2310_003794 [Rhizobium leguminosarum]|jgi:hypothetical protein|uniref:Uncharacterized protein n=1 Tax=Rhizobium esperanzae TaxID=1967781 RepID=A0A7W6XY86_9HYPH|nr:hypothetical protein [Rhizobium esperanzae]MDH6203113.1 hypothetical protein [Rhizobium leguminosarum]
MSEKKAALVISVHVADFVWRCGGAIALHAKGVTTSQAPVLRRVRKSGGRAAKYAEGFQSVFPRTVDEL